MKILLALLLLTGVCYADEYDHTMHQLDSFNLRMDTDRRPGGTIGHYQEWQHEQNVLDNQWRLHQQLNQIKEERNEQLLQEKTRNNRSNSMDW